MNDADDDGIPDYLQELINASDGVGNTDPDFATQNPTQSQVDAYNDALDENANLETIQDYGEQVLEDL